MKPKESAMRWRAWIVLGMLAAMIQVAGCSEVEISGKNAADVFKDPQTLALVNAACDGDIPKIDALVKQGANVNATGYRDMSVLGWTMACHSHRGFERLLELGANPNYRMEGDLSVTWLAAGSRDEEWLPMVLAHGGNPNITANNPFPSALSIAIEQRRMQNVELLLKHGVDVNQHDSVGNTAATDAIALGRYDVVEMLLKHGYDFKLQNLTDRAYLRGVSPNSPMNAVRLQVLEILTSKGFHPNLVPHLGGPPTGLAPPSSDSGGGHP